MKRLVPATLLLLGLASVSSACDRSYSYAPRVALAVPLVIDDCYASTTTLLVAPVVEPLLVLPQHIVLPPHRARSFIPQVRRTMRR